jgi:4-carboxymuconolactone decarboxylase
MADRQQRGIAAFASQLGLPEEEVLPHLRSRFGERMATEAVQAVAGAWDGDLVLSLRDRSLAVVAALAAQPAVGERLGPHVRWAVEHGATPAEIEELLAFLAVYVGYPRASVAMEVAREELARLPSE